MESCPLILDQSGVHFKCEKQSIESFELSLFCLAHQLLDLKYTKKYVISEVISDDDSYFPEDEEEDDDEENRPQNRRHKKKKTTLKNKKTHKTVQKLSAARKISDFRINHHGLTYTPRDQNGQFPCAHNCGKVFEYAAPCRIHSRFCKSRPHNWNEFEHFKKKV